jgi:hypothetical protein
MPTAVTIQRGQASLQVNSLSTNGTYPNGLAGGLATMVTAPSSGVSRVILNQLMAVQTAPAPINAAGSTVDLPNSGISMMIYMNNNYNGDGSTRAISPVGNSQTGAQVSRIAFPPSAFNQQRTGAGAGGVTSGSTLFTAGAGVGTNTFPWYTPLAFGSSPQIEGSGQADASVSSIMPTNIYLGPNDTLTCRVAAAFTSNTGTPPTYQVTWSFTLITET